MSVNQYDETLQQLDQEAGTPAPANPYEETIRLQDQTKTTRLRSSFLQSKDITPDRAAEAQTLSQQTGLPTAIIERNFDTIHKRLEASGVPYQQMVDQTPALAAWAEKPQHAAVAKDDLEQLGLLEWMVTAPQRAVRQGVAQVEYGQLRSESIRRTLTAEEHARLATLKTQMTEGGALGTEGHWFRGAITGAAQQIPLWVGALMQGVKYAGPAAATAGVAGLAVGGPVTAVPLFGLGWSAGMIAGGVSFTADIEAGLALDEYQQFKDELGQPLEPGVAKVAAAATGLINGLIEQSQIETLVKHIPGVEKLTSGGVRAAVRSALRVPTVRAALAAAAKTYLGTLTSETAQEVAQRGVTILSGELAKVASGQSIPLRTPSDIGADLASEAAGAVQSFALTLAPGPLLEARIDLRRARQAAQNVNFFTALGEGIANSKTAQRAPGAVQALLEQATQDGPISHVYAPTDTWTTYWQSKGVDPAQMAAEVTGQPNAYATAIRTGEDLAIPTARYAVTIAGTEHNAYFQNELRLGPDEMNGRESAAFQAQAEAQAATETIPAEAGPPAAPIREAVLQQLEAAGVPRATGEAYATAFEQALPNISERVGVDLQGLIQQWLPDVQSAEQPAAAQAGEQQFPQALFHGSPHDFPRFDLSKIGTGEGAQAYGHGLYFAEQEGTAKAYRDALSGGNIPARNYFKNGQMLPSVGDTWSAARDAAQAAGATRPDDASAVATHIQDWVSAGRKAGTFLKHHDVAPALRPAYEAAMREWEGVTYKANAGRLYQVDIPDEQIAKMLNWDAPASEQPDAVKQALRDLGAADHYGYTLAEFERLPEAKRAELINKSKPLAESTGQTIYRQLAEQLGKPAGGKLPQWMHGERIASDQAASQYLASRGVPGIRYFDAVSRMAGEGTRNVVIFDDSIITITHKDGTPVTAQERKEFFQGERGNITFRQGQRPLITLFAGRDLSTVLHEGGHLFFEMMGDLTDQLATKDPASLNDQQRKFQADYQTLLQWVGVESRSQVGTEQHEQLARGFEAYLLEGKAPSAELRPVFARFRAWLLGIYRSLKGLNVTLTPEVRQVFDRMLATDQAIAEAEQVGRIAPMFTTAADAGMSEADFGKYRETVADASRVAREQLEQKLLAEVRREQTAAWQAQRDTVEAAVTAEVHQQPVYRALAAMQRGMNPDGSALIEGETTDPLKLSKTMLVDRYGKDRLQALPRPYIYSVEGGLDPDTVAQMYGFSSGDEMLTAVSTAPRMAAVIAAETQRRMLAEHGSLLLDGTLAEQAQAAVANEGREEIVRAEMRALGRLRRVAAPFVAAGREAVADERRERAYERRWMEAEARLRIAIAEGRKQVDIDALRDEIRQLQAQARSGAATIQAGIPPAKVLREHARARIAGTHIRDLKPQAFWAASRRAAQQAIDAAARQDFDGAITAKQQELITLALYREAERALEDVADRVRYAKGLDTPAARARLGLAGETYQDQVDGILDRYSFATVSRKALDRRASLAKWIAAQQGEGFLVDLPDALLEETRRIPYQELTVEELVGVTDGLKQILHFARLKNRLLKAADVRDFHQVRDGVALSIREKNTVHPVPLEFRPSGEKWRRLAGWFASIRKIAMLARAMDGNVDGGPMWEAFIRPINAAADAKQARNRVEGANYQAILERHYPGRELGRMGDLTHIPAIGGSLSKEARLAVGLNQGTDGNRDRLLTDSRRKWNREQVAAILDTLDERDWHFIQDTWDFVNTFWPEIEAKQRRVTGVAPEKVEASPVQTKFGTFRGGYYPLAYDKRLDIRAGQHEAATELTLAKAANYVHASTRRGFVEERQKHVTLPLRLELGVMFAHVDQVIHDLTHHEMLIDVSRLLRDPQVSRAILDTRGSDIYQQFSTALQDIAIGSLADRNWMDRSASFIRKRTQLAMLGANLWTAAQQPLGLFNGMQRVGAPWVMRGMTRWVRDAASLESTAKWIADVSPMMRERVQTATPELLELRTQLAHAGGWFDTLVRRVSADKLTQQTILDGYMWHIGLMQRVADIPTWLGQYEKSLDGGETETRAIALADQAVLDSQGGGQIKDLAAVQRGGGMARLFTMFYSYGSTLINANVNALEGANYRSPASVVTLLGHLSLLNIMPAIATVALSAAAGRLRGDPDDPEWWITHVAGEALSGALNGLVMVREATAAIQIALHLDPGVRGYEGPAGTRLFQVLTDTAVQINQGEPDEALAKAVNSAAGILFRYPALQVQRTVDGWIALEEGRTQNPLALVTGAPRKK